MRGGARDGAGRKKDNDLLFLESRHTDKLKLKTRFISGESDGVFIFRGNNISEIKIPGVEHKNVQTSGNIDNTTTAESVNCI